MEKHDDREVGCGTCLASSPTARLCPRCELWLARHVRTLGQWLDCYVRFDAYCARRDAQRVHREPSRALTHQAAAPRAAR